VPICAEANKVRTRSKIFHVEFNNLAFTGRRCALIQGAYVPAQNIVHYNANGLFVPNSKGESALRLDRIRGGSCEVYRLSHSPLNRKGIGVRNRAVNVNLPQAKPVRTHSKIFFDVPVICPRLRCPLTIYKSRFGPTFSFGIGPLVFYGEAGIILFGCGLPRQHRILSFRLYLPVDEFDR
jgi:hypothetical protein